MNRRELLQSLVTALIAAKITPDILTLSVIPEYGASPTTYASPSIAYLNKLREDIVHKLVNPPHIMYEDGSTEVMAQPSLVDALRYIDQLLGELS